MPGVRAAQPAAGEDRQLVAGHSHCGDPAGRVTCNHGPNLLLLPETEAEEEEEAAPEFVPGRGPTQKHRHRVDIRLCGSTTGAVEPNKQ